MELSARQLLGLVTLAMITSAGAGIVFAPETTYYCQTRDIVANCDQGLSSTQKTCRISDRGDLRCIEGWKPIRDVIPVQDSGDRNGCYLEDKVIETYIREIERLRNIVGEE